MLATEAVELAINGRILAFGVIGFGQSGALHETVEQLPADHALVVPKPFLLEFEKSILTRSAPYSSTLPASRSNAVSGSGVPSGPARSLAN